MPKVKYINDDTKVQPVLRSRSSKFVRYCRCGLPLAEMDIVKGVITCPRCEHSRKL